VNINKWNVKIILSHFARSTTQQNGGNLLLLVICHRRSVRIRTLICITCGMNPGKKNAKITPIEVAAIALLPFYVVCT